MCFAIRSCRCGHPIETTERVRCVGVPWRKWDPARDACPGVYEFQSRRPPLEQLCPACEQGGRNGESGREDADRDDDEEHGSLAARDGHPRRRPRAYTEPTGDMDRHDLDALQRQDSHGSTHRDHVPALSRDSQSTWTGSVMSTRSSADLAARPEDPGRRVASLPSTWRPDLATVDATDPLAAYGHADPLVSAASAALSDLSHGRPHDADRPSTSPGPASSPALDGDHRHRFARFWAWKQTKPSQHRRHKSEPKDMRPDKKTRNRWKAIVSRSRSVDSDKSFVCRTAWEIQHQGQAEEHPALAGG
ncbi:hypothetical protein E4U53_004714 [Claviceps sorghi]|nr:hypothetical protein E4U53_004714 [Claviceps sorghi]